MITLMNNIIDANGEGRAIDAEVRALITNFWN
jgi:hypothetical protein